MFAELLEANRVYAGGFELAGLAPTAARGLALLTCMDTRIEPLAALGLRPGDAKILRNAGARVTEDVLRSLLLATHLLGVTAVVVMQHSDCAMAGSSEEQLRRRLEQAAVEQAAIEQALDALGGRPLLAMADPDAQLASDVEAIRCFPGLPPGVDVEGWRYDVRSGLVQRLVPS